MSVADDLRSRWRFGARQTPNFTGQPRPPAHIGDAKPVSVAYVRTGRLMHAYDVWEGPPVNAFVAGGYFRSPGEDLPQGWPEGPIGGFGRQFWQNFWTPDDGEDGEFTQLPNVLEWNEQHNLQNNGIKVLSITVENIVYPAVAGPGGTYHQVKRGYLAPLRGYDPPGPRLPLIENGVALARNEWYRKLNSGSCQIKLWAGYGDALVPVFVGLVDDAELESNPDRIVITARSMGQSLTDMRLFGWNKEPRIKDPVVFQDRLLADKTKKVGYDPDASSSSDGHPPSLVLDDDSDTFWQSHGHDGPNFTEWVEISLPQGRYENFFLFPRYTGMDIWVSLYARDQDDGPATRDGEELSEGWVEHEEPGMGDVPGENGGIPFIRHREGMPAQGEHWGLRAIYQLGAGSRLRVHFRSLRRTDDGTYRAAVNRLYSLHRVRDPAVIEKHWVLVDDVADMVKTVLRWAGYKDWDVESTGVRLTDKFVCPRSTFYIDVIKKAIEVTGYVFFERNPTSADDSLGIPCSGGRWSRSRRAAGAGWPRGRSCATPIC